MIFGYARVSTASQGRDGNSLEDQVAALEKYGCQKIIKEAFTGKTMDRPKFLRLLETLQEGDTLVVCKLDRFARTAIEGVQTVRELFERGVRVHILNMGLIENTLTGNLILTVMLAFAEYERVLVGFPVWFGTCPMAVVSFLEQHDWTGKIVYPFCTSGTTGVRKGAEDIAKYSGADVKEGLRIKKVNKDEILKWLETYDD